jgi:nitrite reductase (cytochrome c-552)
MSPIKNDLRACEQCHTETQDQLRTQIFTIQDRTVSMMIRSGNATAVAAKLIEKVHEVQAAGKEIDKNLYEKAKDFYMEAFLRSLYIGAENSVGFHNPTEAMRILGDSTAFAMKSEALLRQALTKAGVKVPIVVDLELAKYLDNRGAKKLMGQPEMEIKDPFGVQEKLIGDKP